MKAINQKAQAIMDILTAGVTLETPKKLDKGGYMAVHVELISNDPLIPIFSVAHYGEQNGDLMRDPDMEFIKADGKYYPISYRNDYMGTWDKPVEFEDGKITGFRPGAQMHLATFAGEWMKNIKHQQEL